MLRRKSKNSKECIKNAPKIYETKGRKHTTEKRIYDEKNGLWYELKGDYYYPCLTLPEGKDVEVGLWGQRHGEYLKRRKRNFYLSLLTSGNLNEYLAEVNERAEEMFFRLVEQLAEKEGVTEKLKADNQMLWVQKMNNIRNRATEIVNAEVVNS